MIPTEQSSKGLPRLVLRYFGVMKLGSATSVSTFGGMPPKGQTPIIKTQSKRLRSNLISAVNNQGKLRFMMYRETMTAKVLIRFMGSLIKDTPLKVFLILDNLRVHHAKLVKAWVEMRDRCRDH